MQSSQFGCGTASFALGGHYKVCIFVDEITPCIVTQLPETATWDAVYLGVVLIRGPSVFCQLCSGGMCCSEGSFPCGAVMEMPAYPPTGHIIPGGSSPLMLYHRRIQGDKTVYQILCQGKAN